MAWRHFDFWQALCDTPGCPNSRNDSDEWTAWIDQESALKEFVEYGGEITDGINRCALCTGNYVPPAHDHVHGDGPGQHSH